MIIEVPNASHYEESGFGYLNLAWTEAISHLLHVNDAKETWWDASADDEDDDAPSEQEQRFWQRVQKHLGQSLSLSVQGTEFLLKGRIARISPYLLIANKVAEWPKQNSDGNIRFADFKTVDAQDLCRLYGAVSENPLDDEFTDLFTQLRRKRNVLVHSVDNSLKLVAKEILVNCLVVSEHLIGQQKWFGVRREYQVSDVEDYEDSCVNCVLGREFGILMEVLEPAQLHRFLGLNKRRRYYRCPSCQGECADWGLRTLSAFFPTKEPGQRELYCFVCEETFDVERSKCLDEECQGDVLYEDDCLTCGETQDKFRW
ncbi:hypothetical protein [Rhodopirellula sp. P2]|uniref:hypothetical protein n=1 Tax=Rhodopirellula sp. P2 TaxID=2127060 RepID=UPI0023676067|nr:hypothetical protein [Rhodopirellula sp. P2]WDQ16446.1 hypothetical protein PSR62_22890 [Rhodopirellula sp. P2]